MDNNITIKSLLTDIGDAIREKNGETDKIIANEMPNKIRALSTSGGSNEIWYPEVNDNGDISWGKSNTNISPTPQNIKGPQGQGINWRGLYSSVETYNILDAVFYNNNSYICTVNNNTKNPSASITDTNEFNALIAYNSPEVQGNFLGLLNSSEIYKFLLEDKVNFSSLLRLADNSAENINKLVRTNECNNRRASNRNNSRWSSSNSSQ